MIYFVGPFPPPLHGMSAINQAVYERLLNEKKNIIKLDTAPKTLKRDLFSRFSRLGKILRAWFRLLQAQGKRDVLYLSLSGGWGQIYDFVSLLIARLKKMRCIIHHHNFSYLQRKRVLTALLFLVTGEDTYHVVLCHEMANVLYQQYGRHLKTLILSNLSFLINQSNKFSYPMALQRIGFLSNITRAKGGETMIRLAQEIREAALPLRVIMAGPCPEDDLEKQLQRAVKEGLLEWRGPVYGEEKTKFWQEIDVLVFPSYENEAEPLVVWEALMASRPVITFRRGCLTSQVGDAACLIEPDKDFVKVTVDILAHWLNDKRRYLTMVYKTHSRYAAMIEQAHSKWQSLSQLLE
jgi:glycosyltransferase involved in cell wall biosynthesis